ncbi:MAG: hypothetical protein CBC46_09750 [Verrucomicrobiaceae bacterium TMED86]|nr:MAG: hypothetical protein CBC46_09750 [Verrucomicrobiaceae bacterium TMED86]
MPIFHHAGLRHPSRWHTQRSHPIHHHRNQLRQDHRKQASPHFPEFPPQACSLANLKHRDDPDLYPVISKSNYVPPHPHPWAKERHR